MTGILFALTAGIFVALQTVFNARVGEHLGLWETTVIVHLVGLAFALVMWRLLGEGDLTRWRTLNPLYLIGGAFGVIIVYSAARGVLTLGTAMAVSVLIVTQLTVALLIDIFGLFGTPRIALDWTKPLGLLVMILGIVIYKWKG